MSDREAALRELAEVLKSLHEIELEADQIDDPLIRAHVFDRLEVISARRRSVAEEIRWDILATDAPT